MVICAAAAQQQTRCCPASVAHYEMESLVGVGAFGTVARCRDRRSGVICAIKCIAKRTDGSAELEAGIMQDVTHPNIVRVQTYLEGKATAFIVMELCLGGDLFSILDRRRSGVSEEDAAAASRQVLHALEHLHSRHVAHLDIKPENLLLAKLGPIAGNVVKVADFGSAARFDNGPLTKPAGSSLYVAPEVLVQPAYDSAADLWSTGIVLHELLVGQRPFSGLQDLLLSPQCTLQSRFWSRVSEPAHKLVLGLLEPESAQRLTAAEALKALWLQPSGDVES